jgi:D-glycero-beta-D-manno-heptose-7-phosphate kinase
MNRSPREVVAGFADASALVIGDVMLDAYLWGRVDRISPEAPVPVVQVHQRSARLGGAANVALNLRALGAQTMVASVVGNDDAAATLDALFQEHGIPQGGLVMAAGRRTTVKTRVISGHQHVVRVDEEIDDDLDADTERIFLGHCLGLLRKHRPGVVIFEDYDKGVLTPNVIVGIVTEARAMGIPTAVDPKKRHFFDYQGVDLFKPNLKELREGLKLDIPSGDLQAVKEGAEQLQARLGNRASLITLSEHGIYARAGGSEHHIPAHMRSIADVSGAGDTVIAVAALCLAQGLPLADVAAWANLAGGLVCEHVGVVPVDPERLLAEAERLGIGTVRPA